MKVKTLIAHDSATFGYDYHKRVGSVYELPDVDAESLIEQKIVEKHGSEKSTSK